MLEELYKFHNEWLAIARVMTATEQDAEDLVQDMYIKLHEKIDSVERIRYGKDDINRYFVYTTIRNMAMDKIRKRSADVVYIDYINELDTPDYECQYKDVLEEIEIEMNTWNWFDRTLFKTYMESDLSMRDIQSGSNISLRTIYYTIKKCKKRIKTRLNGKDT
jgi:RNA polymerase sigma-70 factor (ECF subfamily)